MIDRPRILVVEDEAITALDLEETLSLLGYNVARVVATAEDAVAAAAAAPFDLVLTDIVLRGPMDGITAAMKIRTDYGIPIVFLTAYGDLRTLSRARDAEPYGYLIKPFHAEALRATVDTALRRASLERQLVHNEAELRSLSAALIGAREEERASVAREIHDELGQILTLIRIELAWIRNHPDMPPDMTAHRHEDLMRSADQAIASVRRIASALRPPVLDDGGLARALDWQCREFSQRTGVATLVTIQVPPDVESALPPRVTTALFRVLQESLTNVARHANTSEVAVTLAWSNVGLRLCVSDDGVGLSAEASADRKPLGIVGMRERAIGVGGTLDLRIGLDGMGTEVTVTIPTEALKSKVEP
jgi:signal transduction histidine kinase